MLRLVIGAIRRRRSQALLLFLLGAVAATVAAAAPGYVAAGVQSLAASGVESAVPGERVIAVDWVQKFGQPVPATGMLVAEGFFETLGVEPAAGRLFRREEFVHHAQPASARSTTAPA